MKKIFLIFTLLVSSYGFAETRLYTDYAIKPSYEVCSSKSLQLTITCVTSYVLDGFDPQSGLHAVQTPKGTFFFQAVVWK